MATADSPKPRRFPLSLLVLVGGSIVAVALILISLFPGRFMPATAAVRPAEERHWEKVPPPPPAKRTPGTITTLPIAAEVSTSLGAAGGTAEDDLSTIELIISEYARHNGGKPVGENEEVVAALLGKNQARLAYLEDHGVFLNSSRQLIDRWGTPYFFHQLSARETEVRSAGPDRIFHTADDLVR